MVYVIPTFHNPTGKTLTRERRQRLAELGSQYDVLILEDDPYRDLRYSGEELPPIKVFDKTGHTVLANSFSKIFSPGSRLATSWRLRRSWSGSSTPRRRRTLIRRPWLRYCAPSSSSGATSTST